MCGGRGILAKAVCTAASSTFPKDFQDGLIQHLILLPYLIQRLSLCYPEK